MGRRIYAFWFRGLAFGDDACLGASESGALWIFELLQDSFLEVMSRCIGLGVSNYGSVFVRPLSKDILALLYT